MSLTQFIKGKEVSQLLDHYCPAPSFTMEVDIRAKPQTNNYALVGTAFDYMLRLYLLRWNRRVHRRNWVAELAPYLLVGKEKEVANKAIGNIHDNLDDIGSWPAHCLRLARLDGVYRHGVFDTSVIKEKDAKDLENLANLAIFVPEFRDRYEVWLNPTFGVGSCMVGGADADVILDDTLIEIKTTKHFKLTPGMWRQLIGYLILNKIDGSNTLNKVGVYFSRHGKLITWNVPDIPDTLITDFIHLAGG